MKRLLLFLPLFGCPSKEIACTDLAAVSVNLTVVDADGSAVPGAVATFDSGSGPSECFALNEKEFGCGYEVKGTIQIHVEAPGFRSVDQSVEVGADECHVIGELVTVTLDQVDCTDVEIPGVVATVAGSTGESLEDVTVEWGLANADMMPQPCDLQEDGSWDCASEHSGDIEVYASAGGHVPEMQTVTVELDADGCHPVTQTVDFQLDWAPD